MLFSNPRHHLDNAATSFPKPAEVHEATALALHVAGNPSRGSGASSLSAEAALQEARREVATFLGQSDPARLAFTLNATDALNMALAGLMRPGATVVTSVLEHGAVLRPLEHRARLAGCRVVSVVPGEDGRVDPRQVAAAARDACVVALTLASNVTGVRQPLEEVAALLPEPVPLIIDAAQAAGSLPVDAAAFGPRAVTCFTGHKALLGPMGCGGIIVGAGVDMPAWREGGTGDGAFVQPEAMPMRLESGTPPLPAILGLAAGVRWWRTRGPGAVRAREADQFARIVDALQAAGAEMPGFGASLLPRAPLVSFRLPGWTPEELAGVIETEHGVTLRAGLHCAPAAHRHLGTWPDGLVRASVGPTTPEESVTALRDALQDLAAG